MEKTLPEQKKSSIIFEHTSKHNILKIADKTYNPDEIDYIILNGTKYKKVA